MKKVFRILRKEYTLNSLDDNSLPRNPFLLFEEWLQEAIAVKINEPNAMILATANKAGIPSVRTVLLKDFDKTGLTFFSNYKSKKGKDIEANPNVSVIFFWKEFERQIRISGKIKKISRSKSKKYFETRPLNSRIAAIISKQSEIIPDRQFLENNFHQFKKNNDQILLPEYWGGYKIIPFEFEFWQGRKNRLHDRIVFTKKNSRWKIFRLSP